MPRIRQDNGTGRSITQTGPYTGSFAAPEGRLFYFFHHAPLNISNYTIVNGNPNYVGFFGI